MLMAVARSVNTNVHAIATSSNFNDKNYFGLLRHDVANPAVLKELEALQRAELAVMHHLVARRMTHSDYHQNVYQRYCTYHQ